MAFGTTDYAALEERRDGFLQLKPIEQNGTYFNKISDLLA